VKHKHKPLLALRAPKSRARGIAGSRRCALMALRVRSVRARSASKGPRPPGPLEEIEAEIADPEKDIVRTLREVAG